MAATYSVTTSSTLSTLYRQVQMGVYQAAQFGFPEWNFLMRGKASKDFRIDWSTRQVYVTLDIVEDINTAVIPEGGYEALPSSPVPVDASLTFLLINKRISFSKTSQYIAKRSPRAVIQNQLKFQAKKAVQGLRRKVAEMFYGYSSGTVAKVSSYSNPTITLKDLYGVSGLGSITGGPGGGVSNRCVADIFHAGDRVAVLNSTGPALRDIGTIAASGVSRTTPSITLGADISGTTGNDLLVFGNNLEDSTMASGTERNLNFTGLLDMCTSTSLHGVSSSSYDKWAAGYSDTGGGRFTGVKLRKAKQGVNNKGGGNVNFWILAQGVDNDLFAQYQAGLRYSDAFQMEIDGDATSKGVTKMTSRICPDGYAFAYDASDSVKKGILLPEPGENWVDDDSIDKLQDISGSVASMDFPMFMFCSNRGNMAYFSGLTQQ